MSQQFTNGYALLIGITENHVADWALPDVAKDISALATVLTHPERCAYPEDNVKTITGQAATRQGILDGLEWLEERIEADASGNATAVIYYSGHGWRDTSTKSAEFYFIPYDMRVDKIKSRAMRATDFAEIVGELKPRRLLVILDCCHAGGMGIKDVAPLPSGYVEAAIAPLLLMAGEEVAVGPSAKSLEGLRQGKGRAVLSSSQGEQRSYIRQDRKMSIFTYHLIEALIGHAQPQEGATEVLVSDVMSYVTRHVPRSTKTDWGKAQEPDYQVSGNFPIALLLGGKGLSKGQLAPDPLEEPPTPQTGRGGRTVNTGGGAYIEGGVEIKQGDFVGRDKIVHGDEVRGDKVRGEKAGRDIYEVSHISGTGIAVGPQAHAQVQRGLGGDDIAQLFAGIYQQIEARLEHPDIDKEELTEIVQKIQQEVDKGEQANPNKIERWLRNLASMADDIFDVTVACLTSPAAGIASVIRKVAEKART